jgi:cytochrome c biogenesis protein ResB
MRTIVVATWNGIGHVRLTLAVCLLLTGDLIAGYVSVKSNLFVFAPMNEVGLMEWASTYGIYNLQATAWFFALLFLLAVLWANTFVCTTNRLLVLIRSGGLRVRKLGPHVMHGAVLVILLGYLASYLSAATMPGQALRLGETLQLPDGEGALRFEKFEPDYYFGTRLEAFDGYVMYPNARMVRIRDGRREEGILRFNQPLRFGSYAVYMNDFAPRKKTGGMARGTSVVMTIRRDPSSAVYLAGVAMFVLGMGFYVFDRLHKG